MAISDMGIAQIREGLASKQFTACEVAQASLDRIAQADSQVHAFLEVTSEAAMAAAQRVDQAIADGTFDTLGPLAGVPVAFKDNMNMTGTHTTCSSRMLENYVSPYTATCVQRMHRRRRRAAGQAEHGRVRVRLLHRVHPRSAPRATRGIWVRVPGGSSGGSAAAVAAGMATRHAGLRHGRLHPPACQLLRRRGRQAHLRHGRRVTAWWPSASSLDQVGPFARSGRGRGRSRWTPWRGRDPLDCTVAGREAPASRRCLPAGCRGHARRRGTPLHGRARACRGRGFGGAWREAAAKLRGRRRRPSWRWSCRNADAAISAYYVLGPCEAFSQPGPLRQRALRLLRARRPRGPRQPVRGKPRAIGFGPEAQAPHHAGQLPALRRRVRRSTTIRPSRCARSSRRTTVTRFQQVRRASSRPSAPATAFKFGEISRPHDHVPVRHVHHLHQHRGQRRHERAVRPGLRNSGHARGRAADRAAVQGREHVSAPAYGARGPPTAKPPWPRTSPTGRRFE